MCRMAYHRISCCKDSIAIDSNTQNVFPTQSPFASIIWQVIHGDTEKKIHQLVSNKYIQNNKYHQSK